MPVWEDFENQCTEYLNQKFGKYAVFTHKGGADSTVPDILVSTKNGNSFYIEAKHSPAQCGQFVLLPDLKTKSFRYSDLNATELNESSQKIIAYMNQDFEAFKEAGTAGKTINISDQTNIFSNWIIRTYADKGVKFFITNDNTIVPLEHFSEYFDISAKYRIKRSGSGSVGKSRLDCVMDYIRSHDYAVTAFRTEENKLYVTSQNQLKNQKFVLNDHEYMFAARKNEYEIRKLSNTYNANVIFSVIFKETKGLSDDDFIKYLY